MKDIRIKPPAAPSGAPVEDGKKKEGNKSVKLFFDWLKKFMPFLCILGFGNWLILSKFSETYGDFFTPWGLILNILAVFLGLVVPWWGIDLGKYKSWFQTALVVGIIILVLFPLKTFTPLRNWWGKITYSQVIKVPPGGEGKSDRDFSVGDVLFARCLKGHLKHNNINILGGHQYTITVHRGFDKLQFSDFGGEGGEVEVSFK